MSIHFISGKPGGGKTLYSVRMIADEIMQGFRPVVTNVPLNLGELNHYLAERYGDRYQRALLRRCDISKPFVQPTISDIVTIINEDDLPNFFTFRGESVRLRSVSNVEWKQGVRPNFSDVRDAGVFYVLDEVHIAFNSRAWAETGAEVLYYLSQHRKVGDDVVCITQSVNNVDKQFRSVAQDFSYIKNLSKQKAGVFRLPSLFLRSTYAQPATGTNATPMESGTFTLDVEGLAKCYDTAKGVGIHGRSGADTAARRRGIHWLWFFVFLIGGSWFALHYLPRLFVHAINPKSPVAVSTAPRSSLVPAPVPQAFVAAPVPVRFIPPSPSPAAESNSVFCTGYFGTGKSYTLFLSDGSQVETDSGRVQQIAKTYVIVDGVRLSIKTKETFYRPPVVSREDVEPVQIESSIIGKRDDRDTPFGGVTVTPAVGGSH